MNIVGELLTSLRLPNVYGDKTYHTEL